MRLTSRLLSAGVGILITVVVQSSLLLFYSNTRPPAKTSVTIRAFSIYSHISEEPREKPADKPHPVASRDVEKKRPSHKTSKPRVGVSPGPTRTLTQGPPSETSETTDGHSDDHSNSTSMTGRSLVPVPFYQLDTMPQMIRRTQPVYPENMRRLGRDGTVKLSVLIDSHGQVVSVEIIESAGKAFDQAAVDAIRQSRFTPALVDQKAVPVRIILPVRFSLL